MFQNFCHRVAYFLLQHDGTLFQGTDDNIIGNIRIFTLK